MNEYNIVVIEFHRMTILIATTHTRYRLFYGRSLPYVDFYSYEMTQNARMLKVERGSNTGRFLGNNKSAMLNTGAGSMSFLPVRPS